MWHVESLISRLWYWIFQELVFNYIKCNTFGLNIADSVHLYSPSCEPQLNGNEHKHMKKASSVDEKLWKMETDRIANWHSRNLRAFTVQNSERPRTEEHNRTVESRDHKGLKMRTCFWGLVCGVNWTRGPLSHFAQ